MLEITFISDLDSVLLVVKMPAIELEELKQERAQVLSRLLGRLSRMLLEEVNDEERQGVGAQAASPDLVEAATIQHEFQ